MMGRLNVTLIVLIPIYGCLQAIWTPLQWKTAIFAVVYVRTPWNLCARLIMVPNTKQAFAPKTLFAAHRYHHERHRLTFAVLLDRARHHSWYVAY